MRFFIDEFRYVLVSLGIHSAVLLALILVSIRNYKPVPDFNVAVFFESVAEDKPRRTASATSKSVIAPPDRPKKAVKPTRKTKPVGFLRAKDTGIKPPVENTGQLFPKNKHIRADQSSLKDTHNRNNVSAIWRKRSELVEYRNILDRLITANWRVPPVSMNAFQILIEATIDRRGNIIKIKVRRSSGLAILDSAAERAIRVSTPFPVFPKSFDAKMKEFRAILRFTPEKVTH